MAKQEMICGIDIGSSQITCVFGRYDITKDMIEVIAAAKTPCRGVNGGVVVDIQESAAGIRRVVEEVEEKSNAIIDDLYLGIRGSHIETVNNTGTIPISRTDKEITDEDKYTVIDNAKAIQISSDRDIIDIIPQEFYVDKQKGVRDPVGMEGTRLEVYVHIVTSSITHLNNISRTVAQAGFRVNQIIHDLLAVGDAVVLDEEKEVGCLLIDFGGQTVGLVVYQDNNIKFSKELQIGGDLITRDISYALKTSLTQAKEIKEEYGVASPSFVENKEEIDYTAVDGRTIRKTNQKFLAEIIAPGLEEIFETVNNELQNSNFADVIVPGGVILTGGGAMLRGCQNACSQILQVETRLGLPQPALGIKGPNEIISNPTFATAIGLLKYKPGSELIHKAGVKGIIKRSTIWYRFKNIFK